MKRYQTCIAVLLWLALSSESNARMVTLVVHAGAPTAEIEVTAGEIAELRAHSAFHYFNGAPFQIAVEKSGVTLNLLIPPTVNSNPIIPAQHLIAGPARIRLLYGGSGGASYCTWKIEPESFPPDKTIIIPEGTGARIALESSTNLTHWAEVYSETHTNSPSNKFFRIKAERIP